MYSRLLRATLVATSLAPVLLTIAFSCFWSGGLSFEVYGWFGGALLLVILGFLILSFGTRRLEVFSEGIVAIKNGEAEVVTFLLAYLLPLLGGTTPTIDYGITTYVALILIFVFWKSTSFCFNPVLMFLGYYIYEITSENHVTYILLTRRILRGVPKNNLKFVRLAEYVFLEKE